jgi:hypothetical protein
MTINVQSSAEAFDISQFFAPEILNPTKPLQTAMVFSGEPNGHQGFYGDFNYRLSKHLDHPVQCHFERPMLYEELPRGIPWHNFPVVSDPFYRISLGSFGTHHPVGLSVADKYPTSDNLLAISDVIVFRNNASKRECAAAAYDMSYILQKFGQGNRSILVDDGDQFVAAQVEDFKLQMSAELRFIYSYLVNFTVIAMKALRAVDVQEDPLYWDYEGLKAGGLCDADRIPQLSSTSISHPLALQWLYRLRAIDSFDVSYAPASEHFNASIIRELGSYEIVEWSLSLLPARHLLKSVALLKHRDQRYTLVFDENYGHDPHLSQLKNSLRRTGFIFKEIETSVDVVGELLQGRNSNSRRFFSLDHKEPTKWKGTGKYPALHIPNDLTHAPLAFIAMKLVSYDAQTKTIALSDKGKQFLDLLHPDCEDPDVMVRWMGPDGLFKIGVDKSCDDWIMRFFSKMKTRINEIEP